MPAAHSVSWFTRFAHACSRAAGRPLAFVLATACVVVWALTGPLFHYSDTWQLAINTGTTVVTFLMVFLIQSSQNRDTQALQIKLDELIRATQGAHDVLLDLEEHDEASLDRIRASYTHLARLAREARQRGETDTDVREVEDEDDPECKPPR